MFWNKYSVYVFCRNCRTKQTIKISKGVSVRDKKCSKCGIMALVHVRKSKRRKHRRR